ncbi:unnamed protein product [Coregonus sp. 'balchen']|nr:unnamed protein product [Coregonus sp. 'balchen']
MLAELLGSLVFVSAVLGASVPGPGEASTGPLYPALAAGMVAVALGHCFGEISGAQVNPAVTLSLLATRRLDLVRALVYVGAQCLGASLGAGALYLALPHKTTADCFVSRVPLEVNAAQALGMELLSTFQLVFTVFSVEDHRRRENTEPGNLAIGFSLSAGVLIGVYWIGPVLGAVLAGVSHEFFFAPSASRQKLVACLTCKDIEMVEVTSVSRSSLSTVTQTAMRAKQAASGGKHS